MFIRDRVSSLSDRHIVSNEHFTLFNLFELIYCNFKLVDDVNLLWTHCLAIPALDA